MKKLTPKEIPPAFSAVVEDSFSHGFRFAKDNLLWCIPAVALEAGLAKPGEQLPTLAGRTLGLGLQLPLTGIMAAGITATIGCPPAAAALAAMFLAAYASSKIEDPLIRGMSYAIKSSVDSRRVAFGGDYEDTETAQKRRQRAMKDIAGVMPEARQWLGQEALILHR